MDSCKSKEQISGRQLIICGAKDNAKDNERAPGNCPWHFPVEEADRSSQTSGRQLVWTSEAK
jgi:hypothetical protein